MGIRKYIYKENKFIYGRNRQKSAGFVKIKAKGKFFNSSRCERLKGGLLVHALLDLHIASEFGAGSYLPTSIGEPV